MEKEINSKSEVISSAYRMYYHELRLYFLKCTGDEMKSEDMIQDLFVRLMDFEGLIVKNSVRGFVFTIARRMMVDEERHISFIRRAEKKLARFSSNSDYCDSDDLVYKEIAKMEREKVKAMPPQMSKVYSMIRFEEKSIDKTAEELNISPRTVEYHLYVSRKEMRKYINDAMNF